MYFLQNSYVCCYYCFALCSFVVFYLFVFPVSYIRTIFCIHLEILCHILNEHYIACRKVCNILNIVRSSTSMVCINILCFLTQVLTYRKVIAKRRWKEVHKQIHYLYVYMYVCICMNLSVLLLQTPSLMLAVSYHCQVLAS